MRTGARADLSTLELTADLTAEKTGTPLPDAIAHPVTGINDSTQPARLALAATDFLLLVALLPLKAACLLAAPLLILHALADLYPGFGVMSAERLRRRWLLGAPLVMLLAAISPGALTDGLLYLALAPLAEAFTRSLLHRLRLWGKPARVIGDPLMLEQNWYLGLIPAAQADVLVAGPGANISAEQARSHAVYVMSEAGTLSQVTPPQAALIRWLGSIRTRDPNLQPWRTLKRLMDVATSLGLIVISVPFVAIAALAIYCIDPGPVIYAQYRRTRLGKPVCILKLRSMYQDSAQRLEKILKTDPHAAGNWHNRFKLQPDPRLLPYVGGFIRRFSIDELPQLLNVLKGEMSLVGPRIFVDYDLAVYPPDLLKLRQSVLAGLTGLWQVSVRSDGDNADKVRYDTAYVRAWSLWQDMDILYRTIGAVLTGRGAI